MKGSSLSACQLDSTSIQSLMTIMYNNLPTVSAYARGLLVKGRHLDFTETVSFPAEVKSYPSYYYLDPNKIEFPEENHLVLFPNPSGDYVVAYFNSIDCEQFGTLLIDNIQGKRLAMIKLSSEQNQVVIDLMNLPIGVYFISLAINNKKIETEKLFKARN